MLSPPRSNCQPILRFGLTIAFLPQKIKEILHCDMPSVYRKRYVKSPPRTKNGTCKIPQICRLSQKRYTKNIPCTKNGTCKIPPNLPLAPKTVHKKHPVYRFRYSTFGVFCSEICYFTPNLISDFFVSRYHICTLTLSIFRIFFRFLTLYLLSVFADFHLYICFRFLPNRAFYASVTKPTFFIFCSLKGLSL